MSDTSPLTKCDKRQITISSSHFSSKTDSIVAQLKLDLTNLHKKYCELRLNNDKEWRRRECELRQKFQLKLESSREKCQREKQKEFENSISSVKRDYEQRLKIQEKEIRRQNQLISQTKKSYNDNCVLSQYNSQDAFGSLKNSEFYQNTKLNFEISELRERLVGFQDQLVRSDKAIREKDEEIANMKQMKMIHNTGVESQRHIRALLEEIRQKERQISKLEYSLKTVEHQLVKHTTVPFGSTNGQLDANLEMSPGKTAPLSSTMKNFTSLNGVPRDEYDKEKQRWSVRQNELESQLKLSEQSNAELVQTKADLIRRLKEFEKAHKIIHENSKKSSEKYKSTCQELKQTEEKFKQCQEENINLKQNLEKVVGEWNKLKEKRARSEKQEEMEKLRQQTLDYCKTISALKQTNIEKDRRLDLLHQKFKRIKRCRNKTVDFSFSEEDSKSSFGSDRSASSISLNTIIEDWAELPREELESNYRHLARTYLELQRVHLSLSRCHMEFSHGEVDLPTRYQEAVKRIEELEKLVSTSNALGTDAEWAQKTMKFASLTQSLQEKIDSLNASREKLQFELQEAREQNELLEFQILEHQQNYGEASPSSSMSPKICAHVCDRSVCTSEDEGVSSMDGSNDSSDQSEHKDFSFDDLKIRFTLLKHRKELRAEDRMVVAQVKDFWESLYNQHSHCSTKEMEWEMKFRECESSWISEVESLKSQIEGLPAKKKRRIRFNEMETELENSQQSLTQLQQKNVELESQLCNCKIELEKIQYMLKVCEESKQRERHQVEELRKQLSNLTQGRVAEMELLENATNYQTKELDTFRRKENESEYDVKSLTAELESLKEQVVKNKSFSEENVRLEKMLEDQHQVEAKLQHKLQNEKEICRNIQQKFQDSLKTIRHLEENEIKTSEELNDLISVNETLTKTMESLHQNQILIERRCSELETLVEFMKCEIDMKSNLLVQYENDLESLRQNLASKENLSKELDDLKSNIRQNGTLLEEKSTIERRLTNENVKLQKQINQLKSYSKQLEAQFEIQLQTVQILKDQMIHLQKVSMEKDLQMKEFELFYQNQNDKDSQTGDEQNLLLKLRDVLQNLLENYAAVDDLNKICVRMESVCTRCDVSEAAELKIFCQYFETFLKNYVDLNNRMDELRSETEIAKQEANKANSRADKLCKQYRDAIVQFGDAKKEITNGNNFLEDKHFAEIDDTPTSDRQFVENLIVKMKKQCSTNCTDIEILQRLQAILGNMLKIEEIRTGSPLEFSGTESEIYGDKSPTLDRYLISSSSSDQMSPANQVDHSSYEEDSLSDSCLNPVRRQRRRNIRTLRRTCSATFDEHQDVPCPPSFVKVDSEVNDGKYRISWGSPVSAFGIGGYKIYVNGNTCKTISNALCTNTIIECPIKSDLESLSVSTLSRNFRFESNPITIALV